MSNFTGSKCIICENEFNDNDDIVVCPECGTPYHRECYQKEGKCVNVRLHDQGKSWSDSEYADNENSRKKCRMLLFAKTAVLRWSTDWIFSKMIKTEAIPVQRLI